MESNLHLNIYNNITSRRMLLRWLSLCQICAVLLHRPIVKNESMSENEAYS